jgi:hypothetical protein
MHPFHEARSENRAKAHSLISRTGHRHLAHGGRVDEAEDKKMITKAVHEHEDHEHGGKHTKLKLRDGGHTDGHEGKKHLAKRARGGGMKHKGGKSTKVQVIVAPQGDTEGARQQGLQQGMQQGAVMGARAAAQKMAGARAGAGAPPGAPPGGGGPPQPSPGGGGGMAPAGPPRPPTMAPQQGMMRAKGGKVEMEAGSGGGEGRIEKMKDYGKGGFKPKDRSSV